MSFFATTLLAGVESTPELAALFDETRMLQRWLDIEAALAAAEAEHGLIPREAAATIAAHARVEEVDRARLERERLSVSHPLVPLLRQLVERSGEAGAHVHWGATTQDIVDCGLVLQLRDALPVLGRDLVRVTRAACALADRHRDAIMAGRTHAQHALPITFGFKAAVWADECLRHVERSRQMEPRVLVGQLAGAVGSMAGFGADAFAIQARMCELLGLRKPVIAWHVARDGLFELVAWCASVGATLGRIAGEIVALQATEVGEVEEPYGDAHVGSSTMPHKKNPFSCMRVVTIAELLRELPGSMAGAMRHLHERDGAAWGVEHATVPRAVCMIGAALATMIEVLEGLHVHPERMAENLAQASGAIASEAVMLALGRAIGREHAHEIIHEDARRAARERRPFGEVLAADPRVTEHLSSEALARALDPTEYVGLARELVDQVLAHAARALAS